MIFFFFLLRSKLLFFQVYSQNKKLSIAIVGAGRWGENLVRNFFQLGVLYKVCDVSEKRLQQIRFKFPTVKQTKDLTDLLTDSKVSGVVIATPSITHHEIASQALKAGKHVYIEKPLARTEKQAKELINLSEKLDLVLMVGHLLVYHPAVNKLKEIINKNQLGEIRYINSDRRNFPLSTIDTNVIWDLAPHDISMISYLLDEAEPVLLETNGFSTLDNKIIDIAHVDLIFDYKKRKLKSHIHNSWIDPQKQSLLTVIGTEKTAVLNDKLEDRKLALYELNKENQQILVEYPLYGIEEPLRLECKHFLDCIQNKEKPRTGGISGYKVVKTLEQITNRLENKVKSLK